MKLCQMAQKGKKGANSPVWHAFCGQEQDGEAFGQPCNREMLTGDVSGYEKGLSPKKTPEFAGAGDGI